MSSKLEAANQASAVKIEEGEDNTFVHGAGWLFDVRGDGNWVRFLSDSYRKSARLPSLSVDQRMSDSELEQRARNFISSELADQVVLTSAERLEAWRTTYQVEVDVPGDSGNGSVVRNVVASKIVFTRVIGNVPVLGAGSKVSVTIANDGHVVGFQYDWSNLALLPRIGSAQSRESFDGAA